MSAFVNDLRFALRLFARNPGTTAVAVLSLALAIGPNAALFSVVDRLFLRPPPLPAISQVFEIQANAPQGGDTSFSYPDILDYQAAAGQTAQVFGYQGRGAMINTATGPKFVLMHFVTENYFQALGVQATAGRMLLKSDRQITGEPPMVLSYSLWQREFAGDPHIAGRTILLNTRPFLVAGIAARGFRAPGFEPMPVDLWLPVSAAPYWVPGDEEFARRDFRGFALFARLPDPNQKPRVEAILSGVTARLSREFPRTNVAQTAVLVSESARESVGHMLSAMPLTMVGLVLLIACANIAGILLAQGEARRREIAVRMAIGAGRRRLVRQLLTESLMLALAGAGAGLLVSQWLLVGLPKILPPLPFSVGFDVHLDGRVLAYTLVLAGTAALACGLAPALRFSRPELVPALKGDEPGTRAHFWFRNGLLIAQVAISQFLLVGAALMARSFIEIQHLRPGFDADRKLIVSNLVDLQKDSWMDFGHITAALQALPGVGRVTYSHGLPLSILEGGPREEVTLPGSTAKPVVVAYNVVGPDYFSVMGTRLLQGRDLHPRAVPGRGAGEAVVNELMARRFWGSASQAVGKFFRARGHDIQVAGVVENGKYHYLLEEPEPYMFLPSYTKVQGEAAMAIEARGDPETIAAAIRKTLRSEAPDANIISLTTMGEYMRVARLPQEAGAGGLGGLGLISVFLAACGLYGLMAYRVNRRTHEIGVRMAMGARPADVLSLVLRESLVLVAVGAVIGVILAISAAQVASKLLYQVSAVDPLGLAAGVGGIMVVTLLAAYRPTRRAVRVNPMAVLRSE